MTRDSTPSTASSTRVPPVRSSDAKAATNLKMPVTTNWMPNSTATTISVRPGQASTATPASRDMIPKAIIQPQCRLARASTSAPSGHVA